jgi:Rrf2 family transcriptional regulator, iron-sulfur cluster assembly transcription factor
VFPMTAEYALRAMAVLARSPDAPLRNRDIAARCQVPERYLAVVMREQVSAGLVRSQRGRNGGYTLAQPPEEIPVGAVLRAAGFDPTARPCGFGWDACDEERPCPLHPLYSELKGQVLRWSEDRTLADVGPDLPGIGGRG